MKLEALGMIEVTGYLGAVSAADAALKAANVHLLKSEKIKGGITTVELIGDVAAITAAVDAGKIVAEKLGCLRASHVIPRMDIAVQELLMDKPTVTEESATVTETEEIKAESAELRQDEILEKEKTAPKKKNPKKDRK
ncbi:BMC domain-containing protein [Enterococcus sp. AZ192]|uniref:BMC domain-containing protein n=1 Tax=unclassified Enterococcus TaxID=2608891 RepID=UPI003D265BF4